MNNIALVDYNITEEELINIKKCGLLPILCDNLQLDGGLKGHVDLQLLILKDKIFTHGNVSKRLINDLEINLKNKYKIIKTNTTIDKVYPKDVPFNICLSNDIAIHNFKYTGEEVLNELIKNNYTLINVNQGYCRCTTIHLINNFFITDDLGIYKTLTKEGIDVYYFNLDGKIQLDGFSRGFIGGASGRKLINNTLYFYTFGDINSYPNGNNILKDISTKINTLGYEFKYIPLKCGNLIDRGSIFIL